ncbi:hypothetical protein [Xanthomonas arboricola]|uniref:hypothetical protein n=1 Tax=Xanthomonas arboricola TaxID=56448 RepID=UPI00141A726D|nr:hypothetical protein [Xanthomonas arboricola]NIK50246.1 hypothetical protein [Xanthomonas arboricola]
MKFFFTATVGLLLAASNCTATDRPDYLGLTPAVAAEARAQPAVVPPGVTLRELERRIFRDDMKSVYPLPRDYYMQHAGTRQGLLGFISSTPFEGSAELYSCGMTNYLDSFTSRDPGCEGQMRQRDLFFTGYIANTQLPGTVPLYRCYRGGLKPNNWIDHFDTTDARCEGRPNTVMDGIMGYVWL